MVNAAMAIDTGSASSSPFVRAASVAVALSSGAEPAKVPANSAIVANLAETLRYNSFEFSYRQDFGKIVLLRQEPETGELVQQFPSEYYLQKYAQGERVARQSQANANASAGETDAGSGGDVAVPRTGTTGLADIAETGGAPVVASAPVISSAPALPSGGVGGSIGGGVNITI
jgi:hypothetical protein